MNRSQISNQFNFENVLDISNNRKDKTEHYFSKEGGYGFDDFMNIGDKTFKSDRQQSKLFRNNSSDIIKKSKDQDSYIDPNQNFIEQISDISIKPKINTSFHQNIPSKSKNHIEISPKFGDMPYGTSQSINQEVSKNEFTLRRNEIKELKVSRQQVKDFKKKEIKTVQQMLEDEYQQLENQAKFYYSQMEKFVYESNKLEQETQNLMINFNGQFHQIQSNGHSQAIKQINKKIQEQRNLESQLTKLTNNLQEEYQLLMNQIKNSHFSRPAKVTQEQRILIDQINALKTQLESIQRDQGSLNLSSTLINNQTSSNGQQNTFRENKKYNQIAYSKIQEIYKQNNISQDPRYLNNIKMSCLKNETTIYSNSQIVVHVSYKSSPRVIIKIGNKIPKNLQKFCIEEDKVPVIKNDILLGKSFIVHEIEIKEQKIQEIFIHLKVIYHVNEREKTINLYIPTGLLNFGQFEAITYKQFLSDAGTQQFEFNTGFRPIDKKMINDLSECEHYMPNLIFDRQNMKCSGLFISFFKEYSLLSFRQKGQMINIRCKQNNLSLIKLIEFIFTL